MKKTLLLVVLVAVATVGRAQQDAGDAGKGDGFRRQNKYQVVTNPFWHNWFLSLGGGASVMYGDNDFQLGSFSKLVTPTLNVAAGKWFTPGLGVRLQYSGLQAKGFTIHSDAAYVKCPEVRSGVYKQAFNYMNLHGDVLLNLNALFGGYNPLRVYEVIPYLGFGITHNYSKPRHEALAVNAGVINRFRLSKALDINVELSAMGAEDKFDGTVAGRGYDAVLSGTVGLTYHFPKRGFQRPASSSVSPAEQAALQQQMAQLAAENRCLQNALASTPSQPAAVANAEATVQEPAAPRAVFFTIGSEDISPREAMNISYLAKQMKESPDATYLVKGYADSATGTPQLNQELSLKRAQAVVDLLVKTYGIPAERLKIEAGGGVDKFGMPILNRVVLVKSAGE